jgi:putative tricarboxylic transport membrane protein
VNAEREEKTMRKLLLAVAGIAGLAMSGTAFAADYKIMAPAAPGGGWDQTARSMQTALQDEGISSSVQVTNVPGAGGTIGLAQALVVPAASDIKDMAGLVAKLKADPGAVSWAGGSAGGTDHITAGLIAKAAGVDPTKVNYIAFSGGGEALAAILGGQVTVGISGYSEFASQIQAGELRLIGISSDSKVEGIDAPTFKEGGVDVSIQNWRMVAAAPGLSDEQKAAVGADVEKMVKSAAWKKILADKGWADTYLAGPDFSAQLKKDIDATSAILKEIGLVK